MQVSTYTSQQSVQIMPLTTFSGRFRSGLKNTATSVSSLVSVPTEKRYRSNKKPPPNQNKRPHEDRKGETVRNTVNSRRVVRSFHLGFESVKKGFLLFPKIVATDFSYESFNYIRAVSLNLYIIIDDWNLTECQRVKFIRNVQKIGRSALLANMNNDIQALWISHSPT